MARKKKTATRAKAKTKAKAPARKKTAAKAKTKTKTTARRTASTAAKRPSARSAAAAAPAHKPQKLTPSATPRTKSEILNVLADQTGLNRKEVGGVFTALGEVMGKDLGKKGCGTFTVPGLLKVRRINKPATKARKGINPFTGEETTFKAKPARNVVKVRPLKALKDMV